MITVENNGPSGGGGYQQIHPVRNGTYQGCIRDLHYQIVVLEGLRRSIDTLRERILELGGSTELDRRVEVVRVDSLQSTVFADALAKGIESSASGFLTDEEQRELAKLQGLYTLGFKTSYVGPGDVPRQARKNGLSNHK